MIKTNSYILNMRKAVLLQKKVSSLGVLITFGVSKETSSFKVVGFNVYAIKHGKNGYGLKIDFSKNIDDIVEEIKQYIKPSYRRAYDSDLYLGVSYFVKEEDIFTKVKLIGIFIKTVQVEKRGEIVEIPKSNLYDCKDNLSDLRHNIFKDVKGEVK